MTAWDALNARSRGLSRHLLGRTTLERLARAPDLVALANDLRQFGFPLPPEGKPDGAAIELAARRMVVRQLAILSRWAGTSRPALAILFDDEDRRSIIALLRGAVQHAAPELRLSGLIPTVLLPERALEELSRQPSPGLVASLLVAWDHPLGPALLPAAGLPEPDLLQLEVLLHRAFAERALNSARREGRRGPLLRYVQRLIDLENTLTVLTLVGEKDARVSEYWLDGGRAVTPQLAQRALESGTPIAAGRIIAEAFKGSPIGAALRSQEQHEAGIEVALLRALIRELHAVARLDPLSPALFLGYGLQLRAQLIDLRRTIWGLALGAPPELLTSHLATPV